MKTPGAFALASLLLLPVMASAEVDLPCDRNESDFEYVSWCEDNEVKTNNDQGQEVVLADCSASGLICDLERTMVGTRPAIHAICR